MDKVTLNEKQQCRRFLTILTVAWFCIGSILPILILQNDYIDPLEWITQGRHLQFGYDRHPYFFAWLTRFAYDISGYHVWSSYIMSQISILVMFICIWKLANKFLRPRHALIATVFLFFIQFYTMIAFEFNNDVAQLPLWALSALFFYDALKTQKIKPWILVGLFMGLSMMVKYFTVSLIFSMFLISIFTREGRESYRKIGLYIAILIFAVITIPNFVWLYNHEFISITFAMGQTQIPDAEAIDFLMHITEPLWVLSNVSGVIVLPVILIFVCFWKKSSEKHKIGYFNLIFVSLLAFGPLLFTFLFSAATGASVKFAYTSTLFVFMGIFFLMLWQPEISKIRMRLFTLVTSVMFLVWVGVFFWNVTVRPYLKGKSDYEHFPGKKMSEIVTDKWHNKFNIPIKYVIGDRTLSCNFAVYSNDNPIAYFSANPLYSDWVTDQDILRDGAIVLWQGTSQNPYSRFTEYCEEFPPVNLDSAVNPIFRNFGLSDKKLERFTIYYAFIPPGKTSSK